MKKAIIPLFITIILIITNSQKRRIQLLSDLNNPTYIELYGNYIAIEDEIKIKIFDEINYKCIITIGREGQGPGEFQDGAFPKYVNGHLSINSTNKISIYDLKGNLLNEKMHLNTYSMKEILNKYIGCEWNIKEDYISFNIYDSKFNKIKELNRGKAMWDRKNRRWELFEIFFYDTYMDKAIIANRDGSGISIYDSGGNLLKYINITNHKKPFLNKDKEDVIKYWKEVLKYPSSYIDRRIGNTNFPKYFPTIFTCRVADNKIYVITYESDGNRKKCLIYDLSGKYIKSVFIPIEMISPSKSVPFNIRNDNIYQLIYNDEKESWELVIDKIE